MAIPTCGWASWSTWPLWATWISACLAASGFSVDTSMFSASAIRNQICTKECKAKRMNTKAEHIAFPAMWLKWNHAFYLTYPVIPFDRKWSRFCVLSVPDTMCEDCTSCQLETIHSCSNQAQWLPTHSVKIRNIWIFTLSIHSSSSIKWSNFTWMLSHMLEHCPLVIFHCIPKVGSTSAIRCPAKNSNPPPHSRITTTPSEESATTKKNQW